MAIAFVRALPVSGTTGADASTITVAFDATGCDALVVGFSYQGAGGGDVSASTVSAATYNGSAMTAIKAYVVNAGSVSSGSALYGILAPASGSHNIVITMTGGTPVTPRLTVNVAGYSGVASFGNNASSNTGSSSTDKTIAVTCAVGNVAVAVGHHGDAIDGDGVGAVLRGLVNNRAVDTSGGCGILVEGYGNGGSTTLGMLSDISDAWLVHAVELVATSAGGTPPLVSLVGHQAGISPNVTSGATITGAFPAGYTAIAGDVCVCFAFGKHNNGTSLTPTAPSGYTLIDTRFQEVGTYDIQITAWIKVLTASEAAPTTTVPAAYSTSSGGISLCTAVYRGVNTTTPQDATAVVSGSGVAGTFQPTGITTVTDASMVVSMVMTADDNALALSAGSENGHTLRLGGAAWDTTTGGDIAAGESTLRAGVGAQVCPVWNQTLVGTDQWACITVALRPLATAASFTGTIAVTTAASTLAASGTRSIPAVTGTVAVSTTASTLAASGTRTLPTITGTVAVSTAASTLAASGTSTPPTFTGTIAISTAASTLAAAGTRTIPAVTGTIAISTAASTLAASGTATPPAYTGTVAISTAASTMAASGTFTAAGISGTIAVSTTAATLAASGTRTIPTVTGTVGVSTAAATLAASGTFTPSGYSSTFAATTGPSTLAASGTRTIPTITGTFAVSTASSTLAASGTSSVPAFTGTISVTTSASILAASGTRTVPSFTGTIAVTTGPTVMVAAGSSAPPLVTGTIAISTTSATMVSVGFTATTHLVETGPRTTSGGGNERSTAAAASTHSTTTVGNTRTTGAAPNTHSTTTVGNTRTTEDALA